jgi:hypothetical protein
MAYHDDLSLNNDYKEMLKNRKSVLEEAITSSNSIHQDVEDVMNEFSSTVKSEIDTDGVKAKLRDLEKLELTTADKKIVKAIEKLLDTITKSFEDFSKFQKDLKYEFVVSKKGEVQTSDGDNVDDEALSAEEELKAADKQFEEPAPATDDDLENL